MVKDKPTPSTIAHLTFSTPSALPKLSESQKNDGRQGTSVPDRTRKKTKTSEILEEEGILANYKLANM